MKKTFEEKIAAFLDSFFLEYVFSEKVEKRALPDAYWQELISIIKKDFTEIDLAEMDFG